MLNLAFALADTDKCHHFCKCFELVYERQSVGSFRTGEDFGMPWFAFTIGGMPEIKLVRDTAEPYSKVSFSTPMGAKISLAVEIKYVTDDISSVKVSIDADVNPMLRMMVERPLKKFLGDVSDKIRMVE
mgnify:FL=1